MKKTYLIFVGIMLLAACASPPEDEGVCYAPWRVEPYKSGRAIPAPGPDAEIPVCQNK